MDELDDTLALLDDLEQLVTSGRIVVEVDEDLPPRFRPIGVLERGLIELRDIARHPDPRD
jgi:hypothetical protein